MEDLWEEVGVKGDDGIGGNVEEMVKKKKKKKKDKNIKMNGKVEALDENDNDGQADVIYEDEDDIEVMCELPPKKKKIKKDQSKWIVNDITEVTNESIKEETVESTVDNDLTSEILPKKKKKKKDKSKGKSEEYVKTVGERRKSKKLFTARREPALFPEVASEEFHGLPMVVVTPQGRVTTSRGPSRTGRVEEEEEGEADDPLAMTPEPTAIVPDDSQASDGDISQEEEGSEGDDDPLVRREVKEVKRVNKVKVKEVKALR